MLILPLISSYSHVRHGASLYNKWPTNRIKFWMAVDVETKYLFNGFLHVGKNESRSDDVSVPTDVVIKLMMLLFKKGHNVTSDNYFTSLDPCLRLAKQGCNLVGWSAFPLGSYDPIEPKGNTKQSARNWQST